MKLKINGQEMDFTGENIADLLQLQQPQAPFAVALNTVFVPKSAYRSTSLNDGDSVEIVRPVVGG